MKTIKIIFLYLFFGLSFLNSRGQQIGNYVSNGSFELALPIATLNAFDAVKYWSAIDSLQSSSYFLMSTTLGNAPYCSTGFQYPRTGNNFIETSFYCNLCPRWYPTNRLKETLKPNTAYCAKYHVVNTNYNNVAIDSYGIYVGNTSLDTITKCNIPLTYLSPQVQHTTGIITDTLNWIAITGTFVANGTEKYIVLGNYKSNAATNTLLLQIPNFSIVSSDVYIDDVSLIELNLPAYAGKDTTIYLGDSLFIGRQPDFAIDPGCTWYKLPNITTSLDTISGIWVKPTTTSTYVIRQVLDCSPLKWDTVVVTVSTNYVSLDKLQNLSDNINLFPNPTSGNLSISGFIVADNCTFSISNCLGQNIQSGMLFQKNNLIIIQTSELESGLYQIHLKTQLGIVIKKFVKTN